MTRTAILSVLFAGILFGTACGAEPQPAPISSEYSAATFDAGEQWHAVGAGAIDGRTWRFDFSGGAASAGLVPKEFSLLGNVREIRIRVRGKAPGHPVRLQLATHFMTFERTGSEFAGDGESEVAFLAPPGEGWTWRGGENDGKIHGPLRIRSIHLEAAGRKDAGQLELLEVRVRSECAPQRACVMAAERRDSPDGPRFVATLRSLAPRPIDATVAWTLRDWAGRTVQQGRARTALPSGAVPVAVPVPFSPSQEKFLEAEFTVDAPGQAMPPAQAYYVAPVEGSRPATPDPASPFGMGLYLYRYGRSEAALRDMDRAAQMAQDAGVKWSREEFAWGRIEPQEGKCDWTFHDTMVATAKRHGISLYGLISGWPPWVKPYTPEALAGYRRFAAAAADRYRADIRHWEIWNEPNIFFWQGPKDMYADLLKQAYAAIKKADPEAQVLGCSTAGIDRKFIQRTMELGGPFDILTIHPYRGTLDDPAFIRDLRGAADLVKQPDGSPREVWITEMGWATHTPDNGPAQSFKVNTQRDQARLLARAYIDALASGGRQNISWYDFRNDGEDPFNFEHNMGIITRTWDPKPAYRAYATMTQCLAGLRLGKAPDLGPEVIACAFEDPAGARGSVLALWATGKDRTVALPVPPGKPAKVVDLMGNEQVLEPKGRILALELQAGTPVFVLLEK